MSPRRRLPRRGDLDLLIFDFDGVMTDNRVLVFSDGQEAVLCNRGDGLGIDLLREAGLAMAIVSTESNPVVEARARKLRLPVRYGVADKRVVVREIVGEQGLDPARVAYLGNDLNDLGAMAEVGWRLCPADAVARIRDIAHWVIPVAGGAGVVRHLAETLLADALAAQSCSAPMKAPPRHARAQTRASGNRRTAGSPGQARR